MPERPKRRKNNKNKRKNNKNNRSDVNKNNTEENETTVVESSSNITTEVTNESKNEAVKDNCDEPVILLCENLPSNINTKINTLDETRQSDKAQKKQTSDDDSLVLSTYIVETPDQTIKAKPKLDNGMKSKSCDNDDSPTIVEITEDLNNQSDNKNNAPVIDSGHAIVTHNESNINWENVDDFKPPQTELIEGVLSSTTIPLNVAECEQIKALSPEEESSLRNYLQTLNLSTNSSNLNAGDIKTEIEQLINREVKYRLRRKGFTEDIIYPRAGPSRSLAVIDEEGSSGSSKTSQRHSYLSDKKSDNEELEDEVFECKKEQNLRNENVEFITQTSRHLIPQKCIRVDAKLKEPEISEARGDWTVKTVEKLSGAELVYLTDSSSSTSSIYDANDDFSKGEETDTSVRIITPTIEVTDAETMLSNTFLAKNYDINANKPRENDMNDDKKINLQLSNNKDSDNIQKSDFSYNDPHSNNNGHEIIVLSTDNLKTNLFVKDLEDENVHISPEKCDLDYQDKQININKKSPNDIDEYDLEIKVLKCELNDAINNLIKEVTSDSENSNECSKDTFKRQDSSSSIDSSQCTAKYNPTHSSLNDVSNLIHDEESENINKDNVEKSTSASHVKDVLHCITTKLPLSDKNINNKIISPTSLRDICLKKISSFPFGEKILEELAYVSQRLQNTVLASQSKEITGNTTQSRKENIQLPPPPIKPRKSSLKITKEEQNKPPVPVRNELTYECLSPSQKMLMEKTNTVIEKDDIPQKVETYISRTDEKDNNNQKEYISVNSIEKMPMKSQTGSRLLALLRDSSNSPKFNSSGISNVNSKTTQVKHNSESYSKRLLEEIDTTEIPTRNKHFPPVLSDNSPKYVSPRRSNISSYCYESDSGIREKSFQSMQNSKKYFHYSTGNLSKEIESDITSIQNMHRYCTNLRDQKNEDYRPRRPSLPKDLCDQQMEYICQKEKEVDAELRRLEQEKYKKNNRGPRAPMISDKESYYDQIFDSKNNNYSKKCFSVHPTPPRPERSKISSLFSSSEEELLREKMYSEYVNQMAEREQRKQQKVIKITQTPIHSNATSKSMPALESLNSMNNRIEQEFISKAKERWSKLGIEDPETEDEREKGNNVYREPRVIEHKIKVIESGEEKDVQKLPSHMQEFVRFTVNDKGDENGCTETVMIAPTFKARSSSPAIWRPGAPAGGVTPSAESPSAPPPPPPPVWSPSSNTTSPQTPRKTFRPVHFEDTPPPRRKFGSSDQNGCTSGSESEGRLRTSLSAPVTGLNTLGSPSTSRLPRAQNPTVTLLQKAREGQISRGPSNYSQERDPRLPRDRPSPPKGDPVHALRKEYASEGEGDRSDYERSQKMNDVKKKIEGIGPTTKDGMPVALRSEVKDPSRWYKKMYDTIHKNKYDEDYVTIRYKNRRGELQRPNSNRSQYAYFDPRSGYLSEPEGGLSRLASSTWSDAYDSDVTTGPRRRTASVQEDRRYDDTSSYVANNKYSTLASGRARQEVYKSQPGRIENYVPGKSSVIDKEAKQWWDEVMDIFDGQNESNALSQSHASPKEKKDLTSAILSKSNMARALKESGYESDSTLIFRRREDTEAPLSPAERRAAYKDLQAGGEPPLRGFRSPAPPRQETDSAPEPPRRTSHGSYSDSESPSRRYVESDVNIHYRCPVRHDPLPLVPERELARQQAEHMKRLYREQKRNKYLQENDIRAADIEAFDASIKELQDMQNRRHQDNFMPSQKTVVPLNRYDEAEKIIAKALYTFNGQTARELSFRKGDIINVRKQIDSNWYEGEVHGKIGLFPYNYVELLKGDGLQTLKKSAVIEGRARAKFDFIAQTNLELPLKKGEVVVLTRRIDHNWWEGRNGNKTGIFPDSYVTILQEPSQSKPEPHPILNTSKPVASPAAHGLLNGADKRSMGAHRYTPQPNSPALANAPPATQPLAGYVTKSSHSLSASDRGYGPPTGAGVDLNNTEPLYVDTNAEAVPYRAMYKYRPQNPDELELNEGDTVYVLEKCDDGWYVGSSQRTGRFGTFPGNYVERI
ncbi:repetitive organellar protein-like isoform X2 [Vanessa cardui]|uniref:repetitive organellar protein-like isoform X2 n=1 Tax=Vanessa cardui TaxID=171605 RepID=UPI001F1344AA|nr:repetitive organellar protein-like isoform X2 [Vanessa cardui]